MPADVRKRLLAQGVKDAMTAAEFRPALSNPALAALYRTVVGGDPYVSPLSKELFHVKAYVAVAPMTGQGEGSVNLAF